MQIVVIKSFRNVSIEKGEAPPGRRGFPSTEIVLDDDSLCAALSRGVLREHRTDGIRSHGSAARAHQHAARGGGRTQGAAFPDTLSSTLVYGTRVMVRPLTLLFARRGAVLLYMTSMTPLFTATCDT